MKKLLFTLFALLTFTGVWANDWTFQTLTDEGGDFYLYNEYTGMFLGRGNEWGTRATVDYQGFNWEIAKTAEGKYTLHNSESEKAGYLFMIEGTHASQPNHVYVDNTNDSDERIFWSLEAVDGKENTYYLKSYSNRYIRPSDDATYISSNSANTENPSRFYWKLVTKDERQSRKNATINKPQDMTWRIFNQNFNYYQQESSLGKWSVTHTGTINYHGGLNSNPCMEVWNGTFDVNQTHNNYPKGTYTLKAQGFYRVGDGVNDASKAAEARRNDTEVINAYFYAEAGGKVTKKEFCSIFDNNCTENKGNDYVSSTGYDFNGTTYYIPTTKERASKWFSEGAYEVELTFDLPQNGRITIGAKNETDNDQQWAIFDNFRLYYQPYFGELDAVIEEAHNYESTYSCTLEGLSDLVSTIETNHDNLTQDQIDAYTETIKGLTHQQLGTDINTRWWTVFSDYYTLKPNDAKHISFTHHCADAGWPYRTFGVLIVTNAERGANGYTEYVATRMDNNIGTKDVGDANWGTLNGNSINGTSASNDGNTFLNFMNGANVDMYIYRNGADIYVKTIMSKGETEYCKYYKTTGLPATDDVKFFFTGEGAYVDNFIVLNTTKPTLPYKLGKENNSTDYLSDITEPHVINDGEAYTYTFKNHAGTDRWQNYILSLKASNKHIVLRSDKWEDKAWSDANFTFWNASYINDDTHKDDVRQAMDNAIVTLTIYNKDGVLGVNGNVSCTNGQSYSYAYKNEVSGAVTAYLSVSGSWLELTNEGAAELPTTAISDQSAEYAYGSIFQTVNLTRTLKQGWNTICLPFVTTAEDVAGEGAEAYAFTAASAENELTFSKVENMEANVPYLFYCETAAENPSFNNVTLFAAEPATVTPEGSAWSFIGNYTPGMNMNGKYGVTGDQVRLAGSGSTLNGMRAYLEGPAGAQARVKINDENEETSINNLMINESVRQQVIYDLSGRRVNNAQKGIYIINGKKVIK